ncbi:glycosyltransferase family 4 protein [Prosthecobacter sp. SYSU 5D2]|uniref:glycosyltransferase family 4 protein n=1 Tax=Prosthecobacter sp. SYSU 5D2 TaxID=3134134 RepID=UPI0031FF0F62
MKILHFVQSSDASIGGSLTVARALVKAQRELGMDAWLVSLYENPAASEKAVLEPFEICCAAPRKSRWTRGLLALRSLVRRLQPDVIHHHDGILWPRLACLGLGIAKVSHGHVGAPAALFFSSAWWTHLVTLMTTHHLIAISSWVAESWASSGMAGSKLTVIPNGVDRRRFFRRKADVRRAVRSRLGISEGDTLLLWAGRLDRETKGLDRLAGVSKCLSPQVKLVVMGDGPDGAWLKELLADQSLGILPVFTGMVEDPAELFGCADAFLFTSKVEPFGLVLLEAASSGLPIYAFPCVGGGSDLLEKFQAYVGDDADYTKLAAAVSQGVATLPVESQKWLGDLCSWRSAAVSCAQVYADVNMASASARVSGDILGQH